MFDFQVDPWIIVVVLICLAAFIGIAIERGIKAHRHHILAGKEELIGKTAVVSRTLAPKGLVFVEGEHWTAVLDKGRAKPEEEVIITEVDGMKLYVTKK